MTTTERDAAGVVPAPAKTWLTTDEAAAHLRMSTRHLLRLARAGRIKGEQIVRGGHWRFRIDWLDSKRGVS